MQIVTNSLAGAGDVRAQNDNSDSSEGEFDEKAGSEVPNSDEVSN